MSPEITKRLDALNELCRRFHVRRLDVFGSVATGDDRPGESDIDFLVEFERLEPGTLADTYFGLLEALQDLFGRPVDLVDSTAIRNPYFRESVDESKRLVYAAA
jgi:predicted nucleotidyltransferase